MTSDNSPAGQSSPTRSTVLANVRRIVGEQMAIDPGQIQETNHLENDMGCDSLDLVEIMMEVEDHFGVSVPDEISDQSRTINEIADNVLKLLGQCTAS